MTKGKKTSLFGIILIVIGWVLYLTDPNLEFSLVQELTISGKIGGGLLFIGGVINLLYANEWRNKYILIILSIYIIALSLFIVLIGG